MVRENVRFTNPNFTSDGTYFYSMLLTSQTLQSKVDDGNIAFSYPLDTPLGNTVKELAWDGVYFWSLEAKTGGLIIRKWAIDSFLCIQQLKFELTNGGTHTYDSDAMAVEHYRLTLGTNDNGSGGYTVGATDIVISDTSQLAPGDVLTFVRKNTGVAQRFGTNFVEQGIVQSVLSSTQVRLTAAMSGDPHGDGLGFRGPEITEDIDEPPVPDEVFVTKNLWIANKNAPNSVGTPAIYKIRASNGTNVVQFSGSQYSNITGAAFYTKYNQDVDATPVDSPYNTTIKNDPDAGGLQTYLLLARESTLMFFNVSTNDLDRSLVMNNIKVNTINVWNIYGMVVLGVEPNIVVYRLQNGTTYKNSSLVLTDETWTANTYNYEKQLIRRIVNSIAVSASPSVIPADGVTTSTITATLRDQYNDLVPANKTVNWSEDSGQNRLSDSQTPTDNFGVARNTYVAGTTEQDTKITAAVTNGLIDE